MGATSKRDRAKAEEERTQLQSAGERIRWRKLALRSTIYVVSVVLGIYPLLLITSGLGLVNHLDASSAFDAILISYSVAAVFVYYLGIYLKLSPLRFKTSEIGNYSGDLVQLILRVKTTLVSGRQAYMCLKNPNPVIRYFGALTFLTKGDELSSKAAPPVGDNLPRASDSKARPDSVFSLTIKWNHIAATEGWKPLYLAYLKMAFRNQDLETAQEHLNLLLDANLEDPRIIYLLSMLPRQYRGELDMSVTGLNAASPASERVFAHALFENVLRGYGNWEGSPACHQPLAQFAQSFIGIRPTPLAKLASWYQERGQFWYGGLEKSVRLELDEDQLRSIVNALSPHREFGLASFQDLPRSNFYLRVYRFFSEIEWRVDQGDVVLRQ